MLEKRTGTQANCTKTSIIMNEVSMRLSYWYEVVIGMLNQ